MMTFLGNISFYNKNGAKGLKANFSKHNIYMYVSIGIYTDTTNFINSEMYPHDD